MLGRTGCGRSADGREEQSEEVGTVVAERCALHDPPTSHPQHAFLACLVPLRWSMEVPCAKRRGMSAYLG
eukprot:6010658-Prymnesium_polylepis.2